MSSEESRLLAYARDRFNGATLAGETIDPDVILRDALMDLSVIGEGRRAALANSIGERVTARANHAASVRKRIETRWGKALAAFDECIAIAEEVNSILVDNTFRGISEEVWRSSPVRRYSRDMVGGAKLKALLLTGLQARACMIATEVNFLLRTGLPQA